jgi:hypothetical protein
MHFIRSYSDTTLCRKADGGAAAELQSSTGAEEFLQKFRGFAGKNPPADLDRMIESGVVQNMHRRMHSSGLGVLCAIYQAPDTGVHYCSGAHGARLNGHKQIAASQAVISDGRAGLA